ncbi:iron complex outermembrane recepter protein [Vibrio xiamenensis]|uniref:Iron complex outermembrane recepter protein n=1 Tax=Vibrio xiamenensis TaxID=861298 RepID=A0A1G8E122_9VIBR|nr:TonB-dependent siderophore receptor [Vibrio xiamenensis]SDH63568.1 iron complex outermembrane recepter protein [Vibrio xiamenensis]
MHSIKANLITISIRRCVGFIAAPFILLPFSSAANDSQDIIPEVETITVTAQALKVASPNQETEKTVTIVDRSELEARDIQKVDEAFRYTPSVVSPYGADNDTDWLLVRGFEPSTYLDGNRLYKEGFWGWTAETYGLESIELVKGPNSVLYGEAYPGGVVNLVQKKPTDAPQKSMTFSVGNKDYVNFGIDISDWANEDGSQRYRLVAKVDQKNGELDGTDSQRVYLAPSYSIDVDDATTLTLLASYLKDDGVPQNGFFPLEGTLKALPNGEYISPSTNYGEPNHDQFNKTQVSLGYILKHEVNDTWTLNQNFNYAYSKLYLRSSSAYPDSWLDSDPYSLSQYTLVNDGDAKSFTLDTNGVAEWFQGDFENTLLVGMDAQYHVNDWMGNGTGSWIGTINTLNPAHTGAYTSPADISANMVDNKITKQQLGAYAQMSSIWQQRWIANVGARVDWVDVENRADVSDQVKDTQLSLNTGLMYLSDSGFNPYASYSESFYVISSIDWVTDKLYKPVESNQIELGVKYTPDWMDGYINLAWFDITQENATASAMVDGALATSQTGEKTSTGVEIEAQSQVTDALSLAANYTYSDVRENDKRASLAPRHLASLWASYDFAPQGLGDVVLASGLRYVGESIDASTGDVVPDVVVWDAMAKYRISSQWDLQFNVNNLADEEYVASCDYGICYYGESRSVSATVNYQW